MKITADTRISELIRANKDSIEAIASLAKPFARLRNPILRKLMAPRVSIAEAAKIGGCSVGDFFITLRPLGFETDHSESSNTDRQSSSQKPEWLNNSPDTAIRYFDVRGILGEGRDPLKQIMSEFKSIMPGQILCIINSFIPTPLIRLLEKQQARCFTEEQNGGEYYTFFQKPADDTDFPTEKTPGNILTHDQPSFEKICARFIGDNLLITDVRHLDMPLPMQTILSILPKLKVNQALYVYHKKIPVYLLEALSGENWTIHIHENSVSGVRMLIHK